MKYYIGIDLGGTNIVAGVVDERGKIISTAKTKTNLPRSAEEIMNDMGKVAKEAAENAKISFDEIEWVGIGAPGSVNQDTGIIEYSNNLDFYNVPMRDYIGKMLNKPIFIDNDANAAAYGEYVAGSAKEVATSIMVTLGTGVGGGIVIDNKIYRGFNFGGAELGHAVIEIDGRDCTCGRKGCLEAYASATGLIRTTKEIMEQDKNSIMWELCNNDIENVNGRTSFDAMRKGDKSGKLVVDTYIKQLACGITNIINIFQPDMLCLGGGICHEGDTLLVPLKELVAKEVYTRNSAKNTVITTATLENDAGIIGAAFLGKSL